MLYQLYYKHIILFIAIFSNITFAIAQNNGTSDLKSLGDTSGCQVWINNVQDKPVIESSGDCVDLYILLDGSVGSTQFPGRSEHYVGTIKERKPEGSGVIQFSDGKILLGKFHNGAISGLVEYIVPNRFYYKGDWSVGTENGYGVMTSSSGTVHEGVFRNGLLNGHGITSKPDGYRIEGEWVDGILNGHGSYSSAHGAHYDGDFKDGKPEGSGNYTANNGDNYQGSWHHGVPDGQGTITQKIGVFTGEWKNGCLLLNKGFIAVMVDPSSCGKASNTKGPL